MREQDRGRAYENRLAKERKLQKQPLSGAGSSKEDLIGKHELVQCKSTAAESFSLKKTDMLSLGQHAAQLGRTGVLYLEMGASEYVVMRRPDYESLIAFEPAFYCSDCCDPIGGVVLLCKKCLEPPK